MENSVLKNVPIYFREYCNHTSVHGFQYLGEKKRTLFERIWWFIVFLICLIACIFSIYAVYRKWVASPVIVNFANKGTPICEIPFPAITICPESKAFHNKFNFTKIMQKKEDGKELNVTEDINFDYMSLICNYYEELDNTKNNTFSDDFYDVLEELKVPSPLQNCSLLNIEIGCEQIFTPIITDEGICYTHNMLDRSQIFEKNVLHFKDYHRFPDFVNITKWSLQNGYSKHAGVSPYPIRAYGAGAANGIAFNLLTLSQDLDFSCKSAVQGYRISLHSPTTIPRPSQNYFRVPLDQSVIGAIQPVMITTSETIKAYSAQRRGCYFSEERRLRYFQDYTSSNCKLECITNYTLSRCDCVNFYMPREDGTRICGTGKIQCMIMAAERMELMNIMALTEGLEEISEFDKVDKCDCLPVCSDLTYEVETSQTDWDWSRWLRARRRAPPHVQSHLSSLTLYFKSDNFITSERNELYGPIDFLANFGGLLGLFTGFSVLSLMEILYFLTVRIFCNLRLYGQWAGVEN